MYWEFKVHWDFKVLWEVMVCKVYHRLLHGRYAKLACTLDATSNKQFHRHPYQV